MFDAVTKFVSDSPLTYLIVAGISALDAFFPVVPSETVVIAASVLATEGRLLIWVIIPAAAVGAFVGDNISYLLGDRVGEPVANKLFGREKSEEKLEWARRLLKRHGRIVIVVARFIPGGRTATTFAAGLLDMPWRKFAFADALAASLWALYSGLLGFFGGETFTKDTWKALALAGGVAAILALIMEGYRRFQSSRGRDILGESD